MQMTLFVPGKPHSQGSKRWVGRMIEADPELKQWRSTITAYASRSKQAAKWQMSMQPIRLTVIFFYTRPKSHYGTGKNQGILKPHAPVFNIGPYDIDKSSRGVNDALQDAGVFHNDAQVVQLIAEKRYAEQAGTHITVEEIGK